MKRNYIAVLAIVLMLGTVKSMDIGSLPMLHGTMRCVALLCVAAWGTMGRRNA